MSERDRELNHGTWRVALVAGAAVLIGTSTAFQSDVWHVMLTVIVCVCVLGPLAGWFLWLQYRAGGTWRPRTKQVRSIDRQEVTSAPARGSIARRRVLQGVVIPPARGELERSGKAPPAPPGW